MVVVENTQDTIDIDVEKLTADAQNILEQLNYGDYELNIWLADNDTIQEHNRDFRNKDEATDILSFPFHNLKAGERIKPLTADDKHLGDLIISLEFVHEKYPTNFYARMQKLLCHGICHLLGHDHDTEETDKEMLALEEKLLDNLLKR
jgi:rRNA maturation RNase YbeY